MILANILQSEASHMQGFAHGLRRVLYREYDGGSNLVNVFLLHKGGFLWRKSLLTIMLEVCSLMSFAANNYITTIVDDVTWYYNANEEATVGAAYSWKDSRGHSYMTYYHAISDYSYRDIVIPSSLPNLSGENCPVTRIYAQAFYEINIKSIVIPSSVCYIGDHAFWSCAKLTSANVPSGVSTIGKGAFQWCTNLENLVLERGLSVISESMFEGCTSLSSLTIPSSVSTIGKGAFQRCSNLENLTLEGGLTVIGESMFEECSSLSSLTIPSSVKKFGQAAFSSCRNLKSLTIEDGVADVGANAFSFCHAIESISLPKSVTTVGRSTFAFCEGLRHIMVNQSCSESMFEGASNLIDVVFCEGVKSIGKLSFSNCSSLSSVEIPSSVLTIGPSSFLNCASLGKLGLKEGVQSIGAASFKGCKALKAVAIPASVNSIGEEAFADCEGIEVIEVFGSLKSIGDKAFTNCSMLKRIVFHGDAPEVVGSNIYLGTPVRMKTYVPSDSVGWLNVATTALPDIWNDRAIEHFQSAEDGLPKSVESLVAAVSGASNGDVIKLSSLGSFYDNEISIVIGKNQKITIDLNGNSLDCKRFVVDGELKVEDSVGGGVVVDCPELGEEGRLIMKPFVNGIKAEVPSGYLSPCEITDVEIVDGKVNVKVEIEKTDSLSDPNWKPVQDEAASAILAVPAEEECGFYRLRSKGK